MNLNIGQPCIATHLYLKWHERVIYKKNKVLLPFTYKNLVCPNLSTRLFLNFGVRIKKISFRCSGCIYRIINTVKTSISWNITIENTSILLEFTIQIPPDCSTAFSPRLCEPWTHITLPLSETPNNPPPPPPPPLTTSQEKTVKLLSLWNSGERACTSHL